MVKQMWKVAKIDDGDDEMWKVVISIPANVQQLNFITSNKQVLTASENHDFSSQSPLLVTVATFY